MRSYFRVVKEVEMTFLRVFCHDGSDQRLVLLLVFVALVLFVIICGSGDRSVISTGLR